MQRFVIMMKLTESGAEAIERMPVWGDTLRTIWEELGGELDLLDVTMGDSDLIACGSFPSELAAMTFAASVTAGGVMTTAAAPALNSPAGAGTTSASSATKQPRDKRVFIKGAIYRPVSFQFMTIFILQAAPRGL